MARGYDNYKNRVDLISSFGRELTRRSGSSCELCGASGVSLSVYEVPPSREDPEPSDCVFICNDCREQLENPKKFKNTHWRSLADRVWSEIPAVKILSVMILKKISEKENWASEIIDEVYLSEEEIEQVEKCRL
ncbi:MAG TPA: phnA protein [Spirochaetota bacterium]|nr:phnA protein [Spirochaetota bacterium]HPJ33515.1 phnA protein [Spirochaetota bacterium]